MLRPRSHIFAFAVAVLICVALYSVHVQRSHRMAENLRLEREYLDWDWQDTPDEIACQNPAVEATESALESIPRVVHFVIISDHGREAELEFYQYLAIKAALLRINPDSVKIHSYGFNTSNTWWQAVKHRATLVLHDPKPTLTIADGHTYKLRLSHQTDLLRLEILYQEGGIYLDSDVYALRPFTPLLQSPKNVLMGHEGGGRNGLGNAVIVARQGSAFIGKWLAAYYESFDNRPQMWNHHSVIVPSQLAASFSEDICKLSPSAFFWPTWSQDHIESMHSPLFADSEDAITLKTNMSRFGGAMYHNQLAYHAWGNLARAKYLSKLRPKALFDVETRFNILLREIYLTEI